MSSATTGVSIKRAVELRGEVSTVGGCGVYIDEGGSIKSLIGNVVVIVLVVHIVAVVVAILFDVVAAAVV